MAEATLRATPDVAAARGLARLSVHALRVTDRTVWLIVEAEDGDGLRGYGEATGGGGEEKVAACFADSARRRLVGQIDSLAEPETISEAAALSGIDQAIADLAARQDGQSLSEYLDLGAAGSKPVALYANINRGTTDRSPEGFAVRAGQAARDGFKALKIAPFDAVPLRRTGSASAKKASSAATDLALARIRAVREAVPPSVEVMVDCHWVLDEAMAGKFGEAIAALGLRYLESPLPENRETYESIARVRHACNAHAVELAGAEMIFRTDELEAIIEAGALDIAMPDVKYIKSLGSYVGLIERIVETGMSPSPHNPSGPVAHAVSWQISAAMEPIKRLEFQYAEAPLFAALVSRDESWREEAWNASMPAGPGIGFEIDRAILMETRIGGVSVDARSGASSVEADNAFSSIV